MNDERSDPLGKFRRPGQAPLRPEKSTSEKQPYVAYKIDTSERRYLQIRPKFPEPVDALSNSMLLSVNGDIRMGTGFTLVYSKPAVIIVEGENLAALLDALLNWKVEFLNEFDPLEHEQPMDESAPFIKSITIHTTRPEDPPPARERH